MKPRFAPITQEAMSWAYKQVRENASTIVDEVLMNDPELYAFLDALSQASPLHQLPMVCGCLTYHLLGRTHRVVRPIASSTYQRFHTRHQDITKREHLEPYIAAALAQFARAQSSLAKDQPHANNALVSLVMDFDEHNSTLHPTTDREQRRLECWYGLGAVFATHDLLFDR